MSASSASASGVNKKPKDRKRSDSMEKSDKKLYTQKKVINNLERENQNMNSTINLISNPKFSVQENLNGEKLKEFFELQEALDRSVKEKKREIQSIDTKITKVNEKLWEQRKQMASTIDNPKSGYKKIVQNIRTVENRLEKVTQKFNNAIVENSQLRGRIDQLRNERSLFEKFCNQVENEVMCTKKKVKTAIEESTAVFDSKDETEMKLAAAKEKMIKEEKKYEALTRHLSRLLDHEKKVQDFIKIKLKPREKMPAIIKSSREDYLKEKIREHCNSLDAIQSLVGGEQEVSNIVRMLLEKENTKYSLYNYVCEKEVENKNLEEEIEQLKYQLMQKSDEKSHLEKEAEISLQESEAKLENIEKEREKYSRAVEDSGAVLEAIEVKLQGLSATIMGRDTPQSGGEESTMDSLRRIEQRLNQLLQIHLGNNIYEQIKGSGGNIQEELKIQSEASKLSRRSSRDIGSNNSSDLKHAAASALPIQVPNFVDTEEGSIVGPYLAVTSQKALSLEELRHLVRSQLEPSFGEAETSGEESVDQENQEVSGERQAGEEQRELADTDNKAGVTRDLEEKPEKEETENLQENDVDLL